MVILTDLSEVLIHGVDNVPEVLADRYGEEVGIRYENKFSLYEDEFRNLLRGLITVDEFIETLLDYEDWPFTVDDLREIFMDEFMEDVPDTLDTFLRISAHPKSFTDSTMEDDFPMIYIVSDHIAEYIEEIMNYHINIFTLTCDQIWSCDIGKIKQDYGFFPTILERLGLNPEECVFIDDRNYNISAAEATGIKSIKFEDAYQLEAELTRLGFEFYA